MQGWPEAPAPTAPGGPATAQWALFSKVPGRKMDYEIIAASMDPTEAERYVRAGLTGTPDDPAPGRPEALPWLSFVGQAGDRPATSVMELAWSGERDGTGRTIAPTRLLCLPRWPAGSPAPSVRAVRPASWAKCICKRRLVRGRSCRSGSSASRRRRRCPAARTR